MINYRSVNAQSPFASASLYVLLARKFMHRCFPRFAPLQNTDELNADFAHTASPREGPSMLNYNKQSQQTGARGLLLLRQRLQITSSLVQESLWTARADDTLLLSTVSSRQLWERELTVMFTLMGWILTHTDQWWMQKKHQPESCCSKLSTWKLL